MEINTTTIGAYISRDDLTPGIIAVNDTLINTVSKKIYSFNGSISTIYDDSAGIIAKAGYMVGDPIFAQFGVNFQGSGYYVLNNGNTEIAKEPAMTNDVHSYFYANLTSGTMLSVMNGGLNNGANDIKEYHIGYNESGPAGNTSVLIGGTGNSSFTVLKESQLLTDVQSWSVGDHLKGIIYACSDKSSSVMWADLTLTEIKDIQQ
ncbi:hypothetical protein GMSM_46010 [Geomonas sp. Red276]